MAVVFKAETIAERTEAMMAVMTVEMKQPIKKN
jgi:hypothetical protein